MNVPPIYFDENATATPNQYALEQAYSWLNGPPVNASSVHSLGRKARGAIELSRRQLAEALSVSPRHLTFTSGATESIHTLINGLLNSNDHVLVSAVEHPAIWGALSQVTENIQIIPVDHHGQINPQSFANSIRPNTRLAIMMAAQNEIGTVYPVQKIANELGEIPLLVDAVQAFGKVPLNLKDTGASYAVLSGHKIGAPQGIGLIWSKDGSPFLPLLQGGAQERGRRAGTENVSAIVGFGAAASQVSQRLIAQQKVYELREYLRHIFLTEFQDHLTVIGSFDNANLSYKTKPAWQSHTQLPNTLSVISHHLEGDLLLQHLDLAGFCLSAGSACSSGALEASPVLLALGYSEEMARRALRISLGPHSQQVEVDALIKTLKSLFKLN